MDPEILEMALPLELRPLMRAWVTGEPVSNAEYITAHVYLIGHSQARYLLPDYRAVYGRRSALDRDQLWPYVLAVYYEHVKFSDTEYAIAHLPQSKEKEVEPCRQPPTSSRLLTMFGQVARRLWPRSSSRTKS